MKTTTGIDYLTLNFLGKWDFHTYRKLWGCGFGEHQLLNKTFNIQQGAKHGLNKSDIALHRLDRFRIEPFPYSRDGIGARVTIYPAMFAKYKPARAFNIIRDYLRRLGLAVEGNQVSRIDLKTDIDAPFISFRERIASNHFVGGLSTPNMEHDTTVYLGSTDYIGLRIYCKASQKKHPQPLTRVEYVLQRKWLKRHGAGTWEDINFNALWQHLTNRIFRITNQKPQPKRSDRCPIWPTWEQIQQATFN